MPIVMECPGCSATMDAPATASGKRARCPRCGSYLRVPEPGWAPPTVELPASPREVPEDRGLHVAVSQHPGVDVHDRRAGRLLGNLAGAVLGLALAVGGAWWALRRVEMPRRPQRASSPVAAARPKADVVHAPVVAKPEAPAASPRETDRWLWRSATPEAIAREWARRTRPGDYRVVSAKKLMFVLIAEVEDQRDGSLWWLKGSLGPDDVHADLRVTPSRSPGP